MSRYRRDTPDYSWVFELFFIIAGCIAWAMGAPALVIVILFAAGGIIFVCTSDGDGGGWDFNPFD